jgi:hypothetical protein
VVRRVDDARRGEAAGDASEPSELAHPEPSSDGDEHLVGEMWLCVQHVCTVAAPPHGRRQGRDNDRQKRLEERIASPYVHLMRPPHCRLGRLGLGCRLLLALGLGPQPECTLAMDRIATLRAQTRDSEIVRGAAQILRVRERAANAASQRGAALDGIARNDVRRHGAVATFA